MSSQKYIVVTPARNEEDNIEHTIASMLAQSLRPSCWVIVNDGSSDRTAELIDAAAARHPWILTVHRPDRGFRKQGGGVIEAVCAGLQQIETNDWDFLVKFDADLSFDPKYFEHCLAKFSSAPDLGIGGGLICYELDGSLHCESPSDPAFHVRGATKIYRRECWDAIGGLIEAPGWDTIDELKANMLGWTTRTFTDVPVRHHRWTGAADGSWKNWVKNGRANYVTGYHPLFMAAKCLRRIKRRPYFIGSLGLAWGYLTSCLRTGDQVIDPILLPYVRQQQMNRLLNRPGLWDETIGDHRHRLG